MRVLVLLVIGACAGSTPTSMPTPASSSELATGWRDRGLEVVREGDAFLEPGGRWTLPVRAEGECTLVFAVSSAGIEDLDAVLYSPEGEVLAEDVEPDARPLLRYCGTPTRAYYVAHAYSGTGTFRFVVARGSREHMEWVAEQVGGAPPIGGARTAALERTLRERGFDRVVDRRRIQLVDGEEVRFSVPVRPRECVTVLAQADSPVSLRIETESTTIDETDSETNGVQVCNAREAVGVLRGRGLAQVVVLAGSVAEVGGPSALWMGSPRSAHVATEDPTWTLEPAHVREIRTEGCRIFEARVVEGTAVLELRSGSRRIASGAEVRGEVCERGALITNAPARARWRWIASPE